MAANTSDQVQSEGYYAEASAWAFALMEDQECGGVEEEANKAMKGKTGKEKWVAGAEVWAAAAEAHTAKGE